MSVSSHLVLRETRLKYSQTFKMAAIHSGIYVLPFGATMCCRNFSSLFSADGRDGDVFAFFWGIPVWWKCLCFFVCESLKQAADHGCARSKVLRNALVVP